MMGVEDILFQIAMDTVPSKKKKQHETFRSGIISSDLL